MPRGQALVEFALVVPVFVLLMLGTFEAGMVGLRLIAWQQLAATIATYAGASAGQLPARLVAGRGAPGRPAATLRRLWDTSAEPWRLTLSCDYSPIGLPSFAVRVTFEARVVRCLWPLI